MSILIALAFMLFLIVLITIMKINLSDIEYFLKLFQRKKNFKTMSNPKSGKILRSLSHIREMMKATHTENNFYMYIAVSLVLAGVGLVVGISINNYFLAPCLAIGCASIPFIYIESQYIKYNKMVVSELEMTLSTITISYERTENILQAVEENLDNINEPIKNVFQEFVYTVKNLNPNIETAIDEMKTKIDHCVFWEWCEALKRCCRNRNLKFILQPVVNKLTKIKIVSDDCDNIIYRALKDYWLLLSMAGFLLWFGIFVLPSTLGVNVSKMLSDILIAINITLMYATSLKVLLEAKTLKFDL